MVPRMVGLLRTKRTPSNSAPTLGGSLASTAWSRRIAPTSSAATSQSTAIAA